MKIVFWTASEDGSSFYRSDIPGQALTWRGHEVVTTTILNSSLVSSADVIIGARVAAKGPTEYWRALAEAGKTLILDLDDDYFHVEERNRRAYRAWSTPEYQANLLGNLQKASMVTVVSEAIGDEVRARVPSADVRVIPNCLPAQYLATPRDYRPEEVTIGWAGTTSTFTDFDLIVRALKRELRNPGVRLRCIGTTGPQLAAHGLRGPGVEWVEWIQDTRSYLGALNGMDVLLAPYRDTAFNQAKFPTKALEAGFLGLPLVASDIRPYREWITHGQNGFLVGVDHEWGRYLHQLVTDADLRERLGTASRSARVSHISQHLGQVWEDAIEEARR